MIFDFKGDFHPLPFIECVTTVPFGFVYIPSGNGGFAVNGYNPHIGVKRALNALKYEAEFKCFDSGEEALSQLESALKIEPILIGPVDMGFLTYDPYHKFKQGSDHYVVALEVKSNDILVNDPDGYVHVPIPIPDFLEAWKAEAIAYKEGSYSMWIVKEKLGEESEKELYAKTLSLGLQNLREKEMSRGDFVILTGPEALRRLAMDIRRNRSHRWIKFYSLSTFRVSAQRCFDSSLFIQEAPFQNEDLLKASEIRMKQSQLYGQAQLYAATKRFGKCSQKILMLSELEKMFIEKLEAGIS